MSPTKQPFSGPPCLLTSVRLSILPGHRVALVTLALLLAAVARGSPQQNPGVPGPNTANALTYLDGGDPFYVNQSFPKLTTAQWVGEPGVDAVVILAVDDMTDAGKYENFLRPILNRLKQIDGRAPVSIMTKSVPTTDPTVQKWLSEGISLEAHTLLHPCPLLANGDFEAAATNYYGCIDLLNEIPGNMPVAFRMPCCDSMNSTSPRFYAELFNHLSPKGNFLAIDSSVMNLMTTNDGELASALVLDSDGREKFRKYFPAATNATTRVSLRRFATTIENYPYPYVINRLCWEFPCAVPSDWEAFNLHGPTNQVTVADWKAALDAVVLKRGVFTMIFHPYGWIGNDQLVDLIDYANNRYGSRVKFLNFREALTRLNHHLLADQPLRDSKGSDNGVRLLDVNGDGYVDVMIANSSMRVTRVWNEKTRSWQENEFPATFSARSQEISRDRGFHFGIFGATHHVLAFFRDENSSGAWYFDNKWVAVTNFFNGLTLKGQPVLTSAGGSDRGVRFRDVDRDGECELLVGNDTQNAVFKWSDTAGEWTRLPFALPEGTSIVNAVGEDNGLRFVDLNGDGYEDVLFANETRYSAHLFIAHAKQWLGWDAGWSYRIRSGTAGDREAIPMISRGGAHPNNGAWFYSDQLFVQNENTSGMTDKVSRVSFRDIQLGAEPGAKAVGEALASFHVTPGFKVEVVACEPQVVDPVAFDWSADGKMWVVEMRDYPLGIDGNGKVGGVVRVLEDTHGDGRYDKSTVFMDNIGFPNGIMPWHKGVLISAAPDIFYAEDTDGDGRADIRRLLYTGFREGNQQHRVNGFEYGLDNWVYAANGGSGGIIRSSRGNQELNLRGHDLRIQPDEGLMELEPGAAQFGRHKDDWGNWFGNDNSRWLWHYFVPEHYLARNPHLAVGSVIQMLANYTNSSRIFSSSQPQQRFNWPGALFEVTSACSPSPYRDDLFGPDFEGSVFICEPANNVIHREVLQPDGVTFTSHRAEPERGSEFLSSTDNWCRPVMVKTGPDGALYFADMYRLVIEHPEYFPDELKHRPDLRAGDDKGRIYRIVPVNAKLRPVPHLDRLSGHDLVAAMDSPNGWQRDTIQRLIVQGHQGETASDLEQLVEHCPNPKARLQALCTLSGLQSLRDGVLSAALRDPHWAIRRQGVALAEPRLGKSSDLDAAVLALESEPDVRVRYQLAFSLGDWQGPNSGHFLAKLFLKDWGSQAMQTALLSSIVPHFEQIVSELFNPANTSPLPAALVERLVELATDMNRQAALTKMLDAAVSRAGAEYTAWQVSAVVGLASALDRQNTSLHSFSVRTDPSLAHIIPRLMAVLEQAQHTVQDASRPQADRLLAITLLGREPSTEVHDIQLLGDLLRPQNTTEIQEASLNRLRQLSGPRVAGVLLNAWRACAPRERQLVLNTLFSRLEWIQELLMRLEQGKLSPNELGTLQQQKLLNSPEQDVRRRAAKLFAASSSDRAKVVQASQGVAKLKGEPARGHELFTKNCSICHRLRGEGQNVGPDLGTVVDKPATELLVAILDPNRAVDPAYTSYTAITADEREFTGILVSESPGSVSLRLAGGGEERLLRSDLNALTTSGRSLMPEGFENGLSPQDLADLIAWILNPKP